jgi:hypothetical protein
MLKLEIGHEVVIEEGRKVRFGFQTDYVLELEHSLASLSKWEEIWEVPFLTDENKTPEQILSYMECMMVGENPPPDWQLQLVQANLDAVDKYINAKMTATWFNEMAEPLKKSTEKITAELVYYWLSNLPSMPPGFEHWHLNKLFTFIKIHDVKNRKPTKQNQQSAMAARRQMNEQRKQMYNSNG